MKCVEILTFVAHGPFRAISNPFVVEVDDPGEGHPGSSAREGGERQA